MTSDINRIITLEGKLHGHEAVCAERYQNIQEKLVILLTAKDEQYRLIHDYMAKTKSHHVSAITLYKLMTLLSIIITTILSIYHYLGT